MIAAFVLAGLVVAAGLSGRFGLSGAATLAALSLLWLVVNGPMEGPILVTFSTARGITGGDLAGVAGLVLAGVQARALKRRRVVDQP
jgi:hypothetical protein